MAVEPSPTALRRRDGGLWRAVSHAELEARTGEYARGLLETGCRPGDALALDCVRESEAVVVAQAALEAGLVVRLGRAEPPYAAGLAGDPVRAAELASASGADPVRFPVISAADGGASLERLAAHGALRAALRDAPDTPPDAAPALRTASGAELTRAELAAGARALREVGDLLRPDALVLIAVPFDRPWLVALAQAVIAGGGAIAIGRLDDAEALGPDLVVASAPEVRALAEAQADPGRRARAQSLRLQRGDPPRTPRLAAATRRLQRRTAPTRCLVVADGMIPRDLCTDLHANGTTVLHAATDDTVAAPVILNRPHRFRFDALGLPLPGLECALIEGHVEAAGDAAHRRRALTAIEARPGPDGFLLPPPPGVG